MVLGALFVVRLDSTGPHNRQMFCGHGLVTPMDRALHSGVDVPAPATTMMAWLSLA